MKVLAIQREAFACAPPEELVSLVQALLQLRKGHWQVVRLESEEEPLDGREAFGHALVYGVRAAVEHGGVDAAAALGCSPFSRLLPPGADPTDLAVSIARDWEADTLVVVGPTADAAALDEALLEGAVQCGAVVGELSLSSLTMVVGAFSPDVQLGRRRDYGGLPAD